MPIWLRQFTFKKIQSHYAEEAAAIKSARSKTSKGTSVTKDGKLHLLNFYLKQNHLQNQNQLTQQKCPKNNTF